MEQPINDHRFAEKILRNILNELESVIIESG